MDKPAIDQSKQEDQTPKSSGTSSTVLSILKRFRSRRDDSEEPQAPFVERLGAANGPLAERISEISSRIEAGRAQGGGLKEPQLSDAERGMKAASDEEDQTDGEEPQREESDAVAAKADARPNPRIRAMGFHNPVFPAKAPDEPQDPDFVASTEPPVLKLHDAPDGVMENPGAPEKRVTEPREKIAEPLDLKAFAEQVRSKLPKPEPEPEAQAEEKDDVGEAETVADADAFKQQFYSRIAKASKASAFEAFPFHEEPTILPVSSNVMDVKLRSLTASSALQSWQQNQSAPDQAGDGMQSDSTQETLNEVEPQAPEWSVDTSETEMYVSRTPESHEAASLEAPDEAPDFAAEPPDHSDYPAFEPHLDDGYDGEEQEEASDEPLASLTEAPEAEAVPTGEPEPEALTEFEPASAGMPAGREHEPDHKTETAPDVPPENVFAALDIDEDEILVKVYDLIQAELQATWGENITLNIRKIVRDEIRAALEKARSEN